MTLRKRRSSGALSLLSPFLLTALLILFLTGRHLMATLHHDTIFEAIRRNDTDEALAFLRAGTDPNGRENSPARTFSDYTNRRFGSETNWANQSAPTPLLAALYTEEHPRSNSAIIQYNHHPNIAVIRALLEHGANVQATDDTQTKPVMYAIRLGDIAVVDLLVQHGAKINDQNYWEPPLSAAASMGNTKMLQYLLDHGLDVNATNGNGETALVSAIRYARHPNSVRLLLEHHIHVNAKDKSGKTALWYAQNPSYGLSAQQTQHLPEIVTLLKAAGAK